MSQINLSSLNDTDLMIYFVGAHKERVSGSSGKYVCAKGMRRFCRFFYITDGVFSIIPTGKKEISVRKGDILYIPYDSTYEAKWGEEGGSYKMVKFILSAPDFTRIHISEEIDILTTDPDRILEPLFEEMFQLWFQGRIGCRLKCQAKFAELLNILVLNSIHDNLREKYSNIASGILYLENHYLEDVSTEELARLCSMSASNFRKIFTSYAGMPPVTYRNTLRIQKAAQLILSGEYTVTEAAYAVRINDVYYFSRLFKQVMGVSPITYKGGSYEKGF